MNTHAFRTCALVLLLAAACDGAQERPPAPPADSPGPAPVDAPRTADDAPPPVSLRDYIAEGAHAHGLTRAQLVQRFGRPDSVASIAVPNRHDPAVTDSVVTLVYPEGRYVYYVVTQGPGEILDAAHVFADTHLRHATPGIGATADEVRAAFGTPLRAGADRLEYECTTCEVPEPVAFVLVDGRVHHVEFDYYVD